MPAENGSCMGKEVIDKYIDIRYICVYDGLQVILFVICREIEYI